jgi:formamidopyrimidine-DNA glycosylase
VPELPEVEAVRRELAPVLAGARIARVSLRRSGLRRPFPPRLAARLHGRTINGLARRGKYLLAGLSSGDTLLMHLGMSGSIRTEPAGAAVSLHDHVVVTLSSGLDVVYNDPRRFGVMDLVASARLCDHPALKAMGPEPLSDEFDGGTLARACARRRTSLKAALLDQRVVAGLGNIYASEALHLARLSPRRQASTLATPAGQPRESAHRLAAAIKRVLERAVAQSTGTSYRSGRFRVYERAGEPCPTPRCDGTIRRIVQAGRSTFYCPVCQRG